jgi:hypothetical protein
LRAERVHSSRGASHPHLPGALSKEAKMDEDLKYEM